MSQPSLVHYTTVTRDIDAPIGELTAYDDSKHSMTFRVRRPDYPDMIAFGTTVLDSLGPNKTRFR
ncbi:hypothetical protein AFLA70_121g002760 [Aspergillus flavus AF70]|nr:hypothetical protein AFLA70_121g002760 [Aspergillus flavus AF70]